MNVSNTTADMVAVIEISIGAVDEAADGVVHEMVHEMDESLLRNNSQRTLILSLPTPDSTRKSWLKNSLGKALRLLLLLSAPHIPNPPSLTTSAAKLSSDLKIHNTMANRGTEAIRSIKGVSIRRLLDVLRHTEVAGTEADITEADVVAVVVVDIEAVAVAAVAEWITMAMDNQEAHNSMIINHSSSTSSNTTTEILVVEDTIIPPLAAEMPRI